MDPSSAIRSPEVEQRRKRGEVKRSNRQLATKRALVSDLTELRRTRTPNEECAIYAPDATEPRGNLAPRNGAKNYLPSSTSVPAKFFRRNCFRRSVIEPRGCRVRRTSRTEMFSFRRQTRRFLARCGIWMFFLRTQTPLEGGTRHSLTSNATHWLTSRF